MTHTLRKYLSNRGSALFMVLSTMTALLIAVMAMYFSVVSSRTVQYAVFNQEQSYQSALSLQNAMTANLTPTGPMSALLTKITDSSFKVGDTISTNGNDFLAFGGTNEEQDNVGAYDVSVTRLADEKVNGADCLTYDMATTVSVNGVQDTTHVIIHIQLAEDENYPANSELFAATGYVPNNAYISGGWYYTKSSYDNEFTVVGALTGGDAQFSGLNCGGSLECEEYVKVTGNNKPYTWVIRGDMYINGSGDFSFGKDGTDAGRGKLYVGGDLYVTDGFNPNNIDIYVIGDAKFSGNVNWNGTNNLYVHGNLTFDCNNRPSNIKCNGTVKKNDGSTLSVPLWDTTDVDAACEFIKSKTVSHEFQKWEVKPDNFNGHKYYVAFNSSDAEGTDGGGNAIPAKTYQYTLDWTAAGNEQYADIMTIEDVGEGWVWNPKTNSTEWGHTSAQHYTIIFDTGDDPNNILYLRLQGNIDYDLDSKNEFFRWVPNNNGAQVTVLYRGQGSVVASLAKNVKYAASSKEYLMHESFFLLTGGQISPDGASFAEANPRVDLMEQIVHTKCTGTDCTYTVEDSTKKCSECNKYMKTIVCEDHSYYNTVCLNSSCAANEYAPKKNELDRYEGLCENRISKSGFATCASNAGKSYLETPNVNFFLVSCDESAEMYLSNYMYKDENGNMVEVDVGENHFYGFIYAPYMTYKGMGSGGGAGICLCGGMVVSDYILNASVDYMNCYPTFMPEQLGATGGKLAHADKSWKANVSRN